MEKFVLNLRLFDGAAGGTAGAAGAAGTGAGAPEGAPQEGTQPEAAKTPPARKNKNPLAHVAYGKQSTQEPAPEGSPGEPPAEAAPNPTTTDTAEARRGAFEELIKGEYKDLFHERVQSAIDSRFKETKGLQARLEGLDPMLQALGSKYGVDPTDQNALMKAIEEDDSYYEEEAERRGLTVEQLKNMKRMEAENQRLRQAHEEASRQQNADRIYAKWTQEAETCAQVYPGFDLGQECNAPETGGRFLDLLKSGVDVKTAYEVIHKDDLLGGAIGYAVQTAQQRTVDTIKARGMRPSENGSGGNAPAKVVKSDPSQWTKKDREEIARRVQRGERIEL